MPTQTGEQETLTSQQWAHHAEEWLTVAADAQEPLRTEHGSLMRSARRALALGMAELCAITFKLARSGENREDAWGVKLKGKSPLDGTKYAARAGGR
jgi:hypothetical protein